MSVRRAGDGTRKIGAILLAAALLAPPAARAQALGHELLGGFGIAAGVQIEPGLHLADRVSRYDASRLGDIFVKPLKLGWRFARPLDAAYGSAIRAVPTTSADPVRTRPTAARHADLIACAACIGRPMPVPCPPWKSESTRSPRRRSTRTRADSSAFGNGCGI